MTNLELVITRLTRKTFIPRELFLLSASGKSAMYDALNTAVKKGLIREKRFVKKSAVRKQKTTIAYSLTEKGYAYFYENLRDKAPWGEYFSEPEASIEKNFSLSSLSLDRYFAIVTASEICELAGAKPHSLFYTPLAIGSCSTIETDKEPLPRIAMDAEAKRQITCEDDAGETFAFADSITIKRALTANAETKGLAVPDVRGGRFVGMVGNSKGAIMLYNATNVSPMDSGESFEKRERNAYISALRIVFDVQNHRMFESVYGCGVLIVDGIEAFRSSFLSGHEKKQFLGKNFEHFWVIPVSPEGPTELRTLLNGNENRERERIVRALFSRGYTDLKRCYASSAFPFSSPSGKLSTVLLHLDVGEIYKISNTIEKETDAAGFKIFCKDWMIPYLKSVLANPKVTLAPVRFEKNRGDFR